LRKAEGNVCLDIFLWIEVFYSYFDSGQSRYTVFGYSTGVGGVSVQSIAMNNANTTLSGPWNFFVSATT